MDYSIEEFRQDINEVITACHEEIEAINRGEQREATVRQIELYIIPEMEELLNKIELGTLPEPKKFGSRYLIAVQEILKNWSWDINKDEKLINMLPILSDKYRHSTF
ncbi:MAG: hypothetical protein FWH40_09740 [Coriobacteriia bacterium]|nr:hypothetical protein [Coriobacteriia bacterium]